MLNWNNPYHDLITINHDHNYISDQSNSENATKHFFLQPSSISTNRAKYVDENCDICMDNEENEETEVFSHNLLEDLTQVVLATVLINVIEEDEHSEHLENVEVPKLYSNEEWIVSDANLKIILFDIVDKGYGSLSICSPCEGQKYAIHFRNVLRSVAKRICRTYSACHWRMDVCALAHCHLLQTLNRGSLAVYVESIRLLIQRKKMRTILGQLNVWSQNLRLVSRLSWPGFLTYVAPRPHPIDELDLHHAELDWPLSTSLQPTIIHVFTERWTESTRMSRISRLLRQFCHVVDFRFDDSGRLRRKFEALRNQLQVELKTGRRSPVFVMGWELGGLLGMLSSIKSQQQHSSFCGVICLGPPLRGLKGERGVIPEDYIHLLSRETLLISGDQSRTGSADDAADFRDRMMGRVSIRHVNIGGCDHLLRLSTSVAMRYRIDQATVDLTIMREVHRFLCDRVSAVFLPTGQSPGAATAESSASTTRSSLGLEQHFSDSSTHQSRPP